MKTSNVTPGHPNAIVHGHVGGAQAGPAGLDTVSDGSTDLSPVTILSFVGATVAAGGDQEAIVTIDEAAADTHIADAIDAHDASAVSVVPFETIAATNVQAALEEVFAEATGGAGVAGELVTDTFAGDGAEDTFALSETPTGTWALVSTNGAELLPSEYAITGSDIVFDVAPALDAEVLVTYITGGILDLGTLATDAEVATAVSNHAAAADPHAGYRLESADHSHATTGLQGGQVAGSDLSGTPGGELGGTWAAPTVDATHSGSAHHDPVTVGTGLDLTGQLVDLDLSEVAAGGELGGFMDAPTVDATHSGSTHSAATDTHIADAIAAHAASAVAFTPAGAIAAIEVQAAIEELDTEKSGTAHTHTHAATTGQTVDDHHARDHALNAAVHTGTLDDAQIPAGIARDAEVATAVSDHAALGDPHTGYRLESADHSHATTGLQAGTVAHSALTGIGATDHHVAPAAGPDADDTIDAAGAAGTASTFARSGHGHKVTTDSGVASTQAFGDAATAGTSGTIQRAAHKHAMPANPVTAHEAAGDPHPGYLTPAEGDAAYQPLDSDLTAIAALTTTAFGRGLLALADAAALAAAHTHAGASTAYAPGSFTVATGNFALMVKRLQLTTTQRLTLAGTARLRIT